jgi:hypothetical protein
MTMPVMKEVMVALSIALFGSAAGLIAHDVWLAIQVRSLLSRGSKVRNAKQELHARSKVITRSAG